MKTFIIAAVTIDGFIGRDAKQPSSQWTSQADKRWFGQRTKAARFCVMGRKTYETFNRPLAGRILLVQTKKPIEWQKKQAPIGTFVTVIDDTTNLMQLITASPTQVWASKLPIAQLYQRLDEAKIEELAICGGSSIYAQWMQANLVDELVLTLEPIVFGQGVKLFNQSLTSKLRFIEEKKLNEAGTRLVRLGVLRN